MLTHEQIVAFLEEAWSPDSSSGFEIELTAKAAAVTQLLELAQYDSLLRALIAGASERARIEASVLAAIQEPSLQRGGSASSHTTSRPMLGLPCSNFGNTMNEPDHTPDKVTRDLLKDQMAEQGIEIRSRSPGKDAQVEKELAEEATWGDKSKPAPTRDAEKKGEDNDYYHGLSQ